MTWQLAPACEAFHSFAPEWDRMNAVLYDSHPMFDSRFIGPLLDCFGNGKELICIHRTEQVIDGALILRPLGFGRWALFLPSQAQAGPLMLHNGSLLESLFGALPGHAWTIDLLAIDPDFAPDWTGLHLPRTIAPHVLTMAISVDGDFADYWQSRSRHLIQNLRRYQRRSEEQLGQPRANTYNEAGQMAAAIDRYGKLESGGWKGKAGTAVSSDNSQGRFYRATLETFAATGQAKVIELHIGDRLAASRLIIRNRNMWVMLKTAYDETLAATAPGRQLLQETLRRAFDRMHTGKVEFYTNASRDQAEWSTALRYIHHRQLYRDEGTANLHVMARAWRSLFMRPEMKSDQPNPLVVKSASSVQELPVETLALMESIARGNVELSADWFDNLQRTVFANDPGVRYYVTESSSRPAALLPLRLARRGRLRMIESLGNYYTSFFAPQLAPQATAWDLVPLLQQANADHGGAHVMRFAPMDPESPTYEALLAALRSSGWIPFRFFSFGNWYLKVTGDYATYLKTRSGSLRSTIKRMHKKFIAEGGTLEIVTDLAGVEPAIAAYQHVYARSWKKPEPYPDFVPGLVRWLAEKGKLRLGIARLAGQPIAAQLWIANHGKAYIFKVAYDEKFNAYSPGTIVTNLLMEHVINHDRVAEVDFLIGDDKYKQLWMSHRRERWGIVAYNPDTLYGNALLLKEITGRIVKRLWP